MTLAGRKLPPESEWLPMEPRFNMPLPEYLNALEEELAKARESSKNWYERYNEKNRNVGLRLAYMDMLHSKSEPLWTIIERAQVSTPYGTAQLIDWLLEWARKDRRVQVIGVPEL